MNNLPTQIANFAITYLCNSKCQNCNIWQQTPENELTLPEIDAFFRENRQHFQNVNSIQLTGGEPFLRTDLPQIADIINQNIPDCKIWIPTNGLDNYTIIQSTQKMLQNKANLGISLSLDGIGEQHDMIRGIDGNYIAVLETLSKLSTLRTTHPRLDLTIGFTLTPENIQEASIVQCIAYTHGADFSFRPINHSEVYYRNQSNVQGYDIHELKSVLNTIAYSAVRQKGRIGAASFLLYIRGAYRFITEKRHLKCSAASESFFLDPNGNIYPCIMMNHKLGNIRDNSFQQIWTSEATDEARRLIRIQKCPSCWVECEVYRELIKKRLSLTKALITSPVLV